MSRPVVIAAGGTGGHMFPALSLAAELRARGQPVVIACDARGARYLGAGIEPSPDPGGEPDGPLARASCAASGRLAIGLGQSLRLLRLPGRPRSRRSAATPRCRSAWPPRCCASRSWCTSRTPCSAGPTG